MNWRRTGGVWLVMTALALAQDPVRRPDPGDQVRLLNQGVEDLWKAGAGLDAAARERLRARAGQLAHWMAVDPRLALEAALPPDQADALRSVAGEAATFVETTGEWEGPVEVIVDDDFEGLRSRTSYRAEIGGESVEVFFATPPPAIQCGQLVRLRGVRLGSRMAAEATGVRGPLQASSCTIAGAQNIAVLLVRFPNTPLPANLTTSFVQTAFFGTGRSVDGFWRENSIARTSATGTAFGVFTLDADYTCDQSSQIRTAAIKAADTTVDFRNFTRIFIIMPNSGSCSIGLGTIGCGTLTSPSRGAFTASTTWMRADYLTTNDRIVSVAVHEGGHNLGLGHATTLDFGAQTLGAIGATGTYNEYGDIYSAMGVSLTVGSSMVIGHYASPHKSRLGWLDTGTSVINVSAATTATLLPYESATAGVKALRVERGAGSGKWLWIEYRQSAGNYDNSLSLYSSTAYSGALIHYEDPADTAYSDHSLLLDFTPTATPNQFNDAVLVSGRTWTDASSPLSITIQGATSAGMQVAISFGGTVTATCDLNGDSSVNVLDVQLSVNAALGQRACGSGDLNGDGRCDVVDLQRVVNAALGAACRIGP